MLQCYVLMQKKTVKTFFDMGIRALANNTFGNFCDYPENYLKIEMARTGGQLKHRASSPKFIKQHILSEKFSFT